MLLRRLFKWVAGLLLLLAVALLIFVWVVLGVNPLEGEVDALHRLTSSEVGFFVRFPASGLLRQPLVERLGREAGFEGIEQLRGELEQVTREIAKQANPQIPFGLFEVDFEKDFVGRDMAFAGTIQNDFANLRLDNFLLLTRVKWYGRFLSALKRQWIRSMIPGAGAIEVEKGLYLKVKLDAATTERLNRFRAQTGAMMNADEVYVARIQDVLLISDNAIWIEHALQGGSATLPADAWFESEFIRSKPEPKGVELYMRTGLSANLLLTHARPGSGAMLSYLEKLLPVQITGELTTRAAAVSDDTVRVTLSDVPPKDGFVRMPAHLQKLYHGEKGDLRLAFSENGIGRFIPRERTVAAIVLNARPDELVDLGVSLVPSEEMRLIEDDLKSGGSRFTSLAQLLRHLSEDLADTHLVIIHRPSVFERASFSTYRDSGAEWTPMAQLSYSIVSRVKDSVSPDKVRETLFRNLQYIGMESQGVHKPSGKFHLARLVVQTAEMELIEPAYGPMTGQMPYVVFSTSPEAAEAIFRAAEDPAARLIAAEGVAATVAALPDQGTVGCLVDVATLKGALADRVRLYAAFYLDIPGHCRTFLQSFKEKGLPEPSDEAMQAEVERHVSVEYPRLRERYNEALEWMGSLDCLAIGANLGVGAEKKVKAEALLRFRLG